MAKVKDAQSETMTSIDTAKAMVDKVVTIMGIMAASPSSTNTFATNPIGFLLQILKDLGVTYEDIRLWLTNILIFVVPSLEISVKAILLTNLKGMVNCSIDPRIPEKYRKIHNKPNNTSTRQTNGIDFNVESIDFFNKLSVNPLSDVGKELYFGLEGINDTYKFARADDFDAFLWFVMHKGKFPMPSEITNMSTFTDSIHGIEAKSTSGSSLLETVIVDFEKPNYSSILIGNTFTYTGSPHVVSICIDRKYDENNEITQNTLVPISDDRYSVNWYARNADQLGKNLGFGWGVNQNTADTKYKGKSRDFSKERAICNVQFIDQTSSDSPITGLVNNKLRFTILPRPAIHIPDISNGELPTAFIKLLFDADGSYNPNGKYTLADNSESTSSAYCNNAVTIVNSKVNVENKAEVVQNLIECYKGLTVYEFNYDYIMSIKMFDAKVIATYLLDSLININVGLNIGYRDTYVQRTEAFKEIIKSILNTDDSTINDCFYSFNNTKYDAMLRRTEEMRAKKHSKSAISEIRKTLDEYDENAELHKQIDVLHRAITQASVAVAEGSNEIDKSGMEYNFVFDLVQNLAMAIISSVLSPKVLMILEVNQQMMGGASEQSLIVAMQGVIVSIINEVRDLIVQELLKFVLKQIEPIISMISDILLREQLENYTDAIRDIIRNCPHIWFNFGNQDQETKLDTVDYADIDTSSNNGNEQPNTNNC